MKIIKITTVKAPYINARQFSLFLFNLNFIEILKLELIKDVDPELACFYSDSIKWFKITYKYVC